MANITYPFTLTAGQPENVNQLNSNLAAITTQFNGNIELAQLAAAVQALLLPIGMIAATGRATADTGWLLCDGAAVSRSTYSGLFAAISTAFGVGDGSTTFNLPDLRGRTPIGVDGAAARVAANDALGNASGAETHALTTAQLAAHTHTFVAHSGAYAQAAGTTSIVGNDATNQTGTTDSTGSGTAHNNMQPYQVVNFQIKT